MHNDRVKVIFDIAEGPKTTVDHYSTTYDHIITHLIIIEQLMIY